ncbi:T9SS type A sorting domain-containing protein [Epilithonimonas mollis]|uniref:Por secretion system C-terminal sorting domain-containing protein n=1 Tax=Epilithonimonas mollis TaxID=216903 RepID=A0A1M6RJV8_9FLAO|nr:T9SS type A sorting domain-containing protein [Epilithonimonas mollis]SHK32714.1 Por secretion system C-terminal sorting domain-containing protein [Epilithonimonas mollis]
MKKLILIFILFIGVDSINAQNVEFYDSNFKAYLVGNSEINTNGDNEIQISEAEAFTGTIDCNSRNITSLKGIENFKNITELICYSNNFNDLNLFYNEKLKKINCNGSGIQYIQISQCLELTELLCGNNGLTFIDTSNNLALKTLYCSFNQFLNNLDLTHNPNLEQFYTAETAIVSLDLTQNKSLKLLDIGGTQISNIDLSQNVDLNEFYCGATQLSNLDVSKNVNLKILQVFDNALISTLDVSKNTALTYLSVGNNGITNLDVSKNLLLKTLFCGDNKIKYLDISKNTSLVQFSCWGNKLTTLDLSKNSDLTFIRVSDNELETLNLKNGTNNLISFFQSTNNPKLTCIQVDNPAASENYPDWQKDTTATYSTDCGLSVSDIHKSELIIYPNPVKDVINFSDELSNIIISDFSGKIIKQNYYSISDINVSNLPKGNYIITGISKSGNKISKKFIKL